MKGKDIKKLKPEFYFGGMSMVDWFEISSGKSFYAIRSGLRHADGETKSPYHYDYFEGGENAKKNVLKNFNDWWGLLLKLKTMETEFYNLSDLHKLKTQLLKGDVEAVSNTITELRRLEEIIKDYEIGMKMMNAKFISKISKKPTKL